jgi:hypothetical protein
MPPNLLGVRTDPLCALSQLPTPNRSVGPFKLATDGFKAGWIRLRLLVVAFINLYSLHNIKSKPGP